jgi:UDP-N-acetylmuramate dehydrogenase
MISLEKNVSLRKLNTFGVEVIARYFIAIKNEQDLLEIFNDQYVTNIDQKLVLGAGSNLLFVDEYFDGLILHMCVKGFITLGNDEKDENVLLKVGAGEKWMDLITYTINHGYNGLECLAGIPGTVGGAPVQNIGAYGIELSEVFVECQVFDVQNKCFITLDKDACCFAYRTSLFKQNNRFDMRYIITYVTFELSRSLSKIQSKNIVDEIIRRRIVKLPDPWLQIGNAGSFFANPIVTKDQYEKIIKQELDDIPNYLLNKNKIKLLAGWLIERCGWKGKCLGSAGTWDLHANILVNRGSTNGNDLWALAKEIRRSVENRFDIRLEPEVNVIRIFKPIKV